MGNKSTTAERLTRDARQITREYPINDLRILRKSLEGYVKHYPDHFSEFERTQLRRVALDASRLADIIEERK